jgi:hypothetical protein
LVDTSVYNQVRGFIIMDLWRECILLGVSPVLKLAQ